MSTDAASGHDPVPLDDVTEPPADAGAPDDGGLWGDEVDPLGDPVSANWFSAEIENVHASDWEADAAQIWSDDDVDLAGDADGGLGLDFSL